MSEEAIRVSYKGRTKEFFFSVSTKPEFVELLLRKAFRIQDRIDHLVTKRGSSIPLKHLLRQSQRTGQHDFTLPIQPPQPSQPPTQWHSNTKRSLSKSSGRKIPPQQHQLIKGRFFIEDFQLFIADLSPQYSQTLFGVVFFDNMKEAQFLGKKILRELVYEYGEKIEFYYSLYPSKIQVGSALLGSALLFCLFRGGVQVVERMFAAGLGAADEIGYLIKTMMASGELDRRVSRVGSNSNTNTPKPKQQQPQQPQQPQQQQQSRRPIFSLLQQRAKQHDHQHHYNHNQAQPFRKLVKATSYRSVQPVTEAQHAQRLPYTPDKPFKNNAGSLANSPQRPTQAIAPTAQSPIKASNINEISFQQHQPQQQQPQITLPEWFKSGDTFTPLQKGILLHLHNTRDSTFLNLCTTLTLNSQSQHALNVSLLTVLVHDRLEKELAVFDLKEKDYLFGHYKERSSPLFSVVLRFQRLGDLQGFLKGLRRHFDSVFRVKDVSYSSIAQRVCEQANIFKIKLLKDDQGECPNSSPQDQLLAKNPEMQQAIRQLTSVFHYSQQHFSLDSQLANKYKTLLLPHFDSTQILRIMQLLKVGDPFVIRELNSKSLQKEAVERLRKLMRNKKYEGELLDELSSPSLRPIKKKIEKFGNFKSLISYLYEFKRINKKQKKLFSYLYVWEDISVLGAFESYLANHDLQQFIETLYIIDQLYYIRKKYGLELSEIERFNDVLEHQLEILFTHKEEISLENRLALEKLVRAGDTTVMKMYKESKGTRKVNFIKSVSDYAAAKRIELDQLELSRQNNEFKQRANKSQRLKFLQQIIPVHISKKVKFKPQLAYECLEKDQPILRGIFELYDCTNDLVDWIENFRLYASRLPQIHAWMVFNEAITSMGCSQQERQVIRQMLETGSTLLQGVYQVYVVTRDREDLEDSVRRILKVK